MTPDTDIIRVVGVYQRLGGQSTMTILYRRGVIDSVYQRLGGQSTMTFMRLVSNRE